LPLFDESENGLRLGPLTSTTVQPARFIPRLGIEAFAAFRLTGSLEVSVTAYWVESVPSL